VTTPPRLTGPRGEPVAPGITFYGADWCSDSRRSQALLDRRGVPYVYVDVEADPTAARWIAAANGGRRATPTIFLSPAANPLIEPSDDELEAALVRTGWIAACEDEQRRTAAD